VGFLPRHRRHGRLRTAPGSQCNKKSRTTATASPEAIAAPDGFEDKSATAPRPLTVGR
jgi:hypothetical protein